MDSDFSLFISQQHEEISRLDFLWKLQVKYLKDFMNSLITWILWFWFLLFVFESFVFLLLGLSFIARKNLPMSLALHVVRHILLLHICAPKCYSV